MSAKDAIPFAKWKKLNSDLAGSITGCRDCRGTGRETCGHCHGDGETKDEDGLHTCWRCDGIGSMACGSCDGEGTELYLIYQRQLRADLRLCGVSG